MGGNKILKIDLSLCRTCLNDSDNMKSIFRDNDICKMLQSFSGLKIHSLDGFPRNICSICLNKLQISYDFRQQCEISYNTFVNFMNDHPDETYETKLEKANVLLVINGGNACKVLMDLVCRTCLNESNNMNSIFMDNQDISKMLSVSCSGLTVFKKDGSPTKICNDCLNKLHISFKFRHQYETVLNFMENSELKIKDEFNSEVRQTYAKMINYFEIKSRENKTNICQDSLSSNNGVMKNEFSAFQEIMQGNIVKEPSLNIKPNSHQSIKSLVDKNERCEICQMTFTTTKNLRIHTTRMHKKVEVTTTLAGHQTDRKVLMHEHSNNKSYHCEICQMAFTSQKNHQIHITRVHRQGKSLTCTICKLMFQKNTKYYEHMKSQHQDIIKFYQCDQCDKSFSIRSNMNRHKTTAHVDKQFYSSQQGDKSFNRPENKNLCMRRTHSDINQYHCNDCDKVYKESSSLRRHRVKIHGERRILVKKTEICNICQKICGTSQSLRLHMKVHQIMEWICKICQQKFNSNHDYIDHQQLHVPSVERSHMCSKCGFRFNSSNQLETHMQRHNCEKPYKCKICSKGFPSSSWLTAHEFYHTDEKKYLCTTCGKRFYRNDHLRVHIMRIHTEERPYKCLHCDKSFAQANDLTIHVRWHTGD